MRILLLFIGLLGSTAVFSQSDTAAIDYSQFSYKSLNEALSDLSNQHRINFSYNPDATASVQIFEVPDYIIGVDEFLNWVLYGTPIDFVYFANTYVLYSKSLDEKKVKKLKTLSLNGRVIDKKTREALPFATILVSGIDMVAATNTDGKFSLLNIPSDTLTLTVTYLGYMPVEIPLNRFFNTEKMAIEMESQERYLPQVQVQAMRHDIIEVGNKPGSLIFNPAQIANLPNLGEKDVFSALRRLSGVRGGIDASSGLRIWGGDSDQNLMMFDGITVYHTDHFYGFLSAFNTQTIKNIQLIKGGYSAKYGGRTAGVVNITGIDGNKLNSSVTLEASLLSTSVGVELPMVEGKASFMFAYRRSYTDILQSTSYKKLFNNIYNSSIPSSAKSNVDIFKEEKPNYVYNDLNAKIHFIPSDKDEVALSLYNANDNLDIKFDGNTLDLRRIARDKTNWGNTGGSVKWSRKWNKRLFTYGNFGISSYKSFLEADEEYFFLGSDTRFSQIFHRQENELLDHTLRIDNTWAVNSKTNVEFGYWSTYYQITNRAQNQNEILADTIGSMYLHAAYLELERWLGKWKVTPGLRTSVYGREVYVEPRFSFYRPLGSYVGLKGSFGIFHQNIRRLNERNLYMSVPETWSLTHPSQIPVLQSKHYILGGVYDLNDWHLDIDGYHKDETGTVDFLFPEFGYATGRLSEFAIGGSRKIWGMDAMIKKVFRNQYVLLSYSFLSSKTKYEKINEGHSFRTSKSPMHEAQVLYSYELKRWNFSASFVISEGEVYTPVKGVSEVIDANGKTKHIPVLGRINSMRLKTYSRLDIGANYTLPLKNGILQAGISVYNLFDSRSVKFIDYYLIPKENSNQYSVGMRNVLSLGFTPSFFLKFKVG